MGLTVEAVVWAAWPRAGSRLAPVLGTPQDGQGQGWMDHPGRWLFIFSELTARDLGTCAQPNPGSSVGMGCNFVSADL